MHGQHKRETVLKKAKNTEKGTWVQLIKDETNIFIDCKYKNASISLDQNKLKILQLYKSSLH